MYFINIVCCLQEHSIIIFGPGCKSCCDLAFVSEDMRRLSVKGDYACDLL